jgi:ferric-dicitrate binding protein FerR (iron transport regulator)
MNQHDAELLLEKFKAGTISDTELALLESWYINEIKVNKNYDGLEKNLALLDQRFSFIINRQVAKKRIWPKIAVAASILFLVSVGTYFVTHKHADTQIAVIQKLDIAPGRNQATLTLANGQKIILTKSLNGKLAQQGGTAIQVNAGTALTYTDKGSHTNAITQYNTLSTTRGEQSPYVLILADGSKVWLNAASSITYPVAFNGKDREVKITGEAYFEVIHNSAHPFKVSVKGQTIEDLGTAFNVNAYDDEPAIRTTLISGSVRLTDKNGSALLKPGQAGITRAGQSAIHIDNVDTESAVAWKNGYFSFDRESLESIMRKISRWYNVDVQFTNDQSRKSAYWGGTTRFTNVSKVLEQLEETGHERFTIEGNKIIITRK